MLNIIDFDVFGTKSKNLQNKKKIKKAIKWFCMPRYENFQLVVFWAPF